MTSRYGSVCPQCREGHSLSNCPRWRVDKFKLPPAYDPKRKEHDWPLGPERKQ